MHIVFVVAVAIALTEVTVLATSVYLHRGLAYRSLKIHPAADVLFRTILWLTTGQSRQQWVAIQRKHHAFTDCEGDPHSPRLLSPRPVSSGRSFHTGSSDSPSASLSSASSWGCRPVSSPEVSTPCCMS